MTGSQFMAWLLSCLKWCVIIGLPLYVLSMCTIRKAEEHARLAALPPALAASAAMTGPFYVEPRSGSR